MKQLIMKALGMKPRRKPLQTRSLQLTMRWRTTTVAKRQFKFWVFIHDTAALITICYGFKDLALLLADWLAKL